MSYYSNPTANAAIGSIDGEIRRAQKEAKRLREQREDGRNIDRPLAKARKRYVGLFRQVFEIELAKPPEEQKEESDTSSEDAPSGDALFFCKKPSFFIFPHPFSAKVWGQTVLYMIR